jgi:hypothetical protein
VQKKLMLLGFVLPEFWRVGFGPSEDLLNDFRSALTDSLICLQADPRVLCDENNALANAVAPIGGIASLEA